MLVNGEEMFMTI